ncbi:MAG: TonB-dependent receptor plug domain-containing protein [Candidatus Cyclobacteriaceae bacterium M3_2C_046]
MRFLLILMMVGWSALNLYGQSITVKDKVSRQPVENVVIYASDSSKLVQTNHQGQASAAIFKPGDLLIFQHPAYEQKVLKYADLIDFGYEVNIAEKIIKIDEVIISANKWEQDKSEVPQKIEAITPQNIAFQAPQTTADVLDQTGQVFMQKSQLGGGSPMIRGFSANSLLIVVDGVRMNNAIYRSGNLQNVITLDANNLSGAEVIFGPGSVIYGSDALGGVMDFHTREPMFSQDDQLSFSGQSFVRFSSANLEKTGHFQMNLGGNKVASFTSFTFSDYNDLRSGANRPDDYPDFGRRDFYVERINGKDSIIDNNNPNLQRFSGYRQMNFLQKVRYQPKPDYDLTYAFHYSTSSDIPRYDRLIESNQGEPVYASWYYGPQNWMMHQFTATSDQSRQIYDQARLNLAYQKIEESRLNRRFGDDRLRNQTENVDVYSLNLDFDKSLSAGQLFYGFEMFYNKVNSTAFRRHITTGTLTPTATRYPDGGSAYYAAASYISLKYDLKDYLIFNSGLRFTANWLEASLEEENEFGLPFQQLNLQNQALNGNLGLVYKPADNLKADFVFSTGFRAPNVDDVGKIFDFSDNYVVVPNPDLQPEYVFNLESSIQKRWSQRVQLSMNVFYAILDNAMVRRDFTFQGQDSVFYQGSLKKIQATVNVGNAYIAGGSISAKAEITDQFSFTSTLTYTTGKDLTDNLPLRHVAPLFGQSSLNYKTKKFRSELLVRYNGPLKKQDLAPSELAKPHLYTEAGSLSWITTGIRSAYYFSNNFTLNVNLENIFDKHYRPYSSGISAPGRNLVISMRYQF